MNQGISPDFFGSARRPEQGTPTPEEVTRKCVCACSRVRGRSLTILRALTEHGPLRFLEIQHGLELEKDLTKIYLRRLKNYGLIEKEINGWRATKKGAEKLDEVDRLEKLKGRYVSYPTGRSNEQGEHLLSCTPNCSLDRSPNCSPIYNYTIKHNKHNKTKLIPKSPVLEEVPQGSSHLFANTKDTHASKIQSQLFMIKEAILKRYATGSAVSRKALVGLASSVLPYVDKRAASNRIDKLISVGFLREKTEGPFRGTFEVVGSEVRSEAEEPVDVRRKDHSSGLPGLQGA